MRYVEKRKTIQIGEFTITPFAVPHDSTDCVGYCVEHEGVVFTLVTDCGHVTEEIRSFVSKANYLVIEANHETRKAYGWTLSTVPQGAHHEPKQDILVTLIAHKP